MTRPHVNDEIEGSPGGFIEAVKRTVIVALRKSLTESGLSLSGSRLNVDMEYPYTEASYPSVWVQFSFSSLEDSGLGHLQTTPEGDTVRQWMYRGRITLTLLSLSSLDRDRISDKLVSVYSFAGLSSQYASEKSMPGSEFLDELYDSPYVSMTLQSGLLRPGGQTVSVGTPWDPGQLVYEDSYSFEVAGEFQTVFKPGKGYILRRIDIVPKISNEVVPGKFY